MRALAALRPYLRRYRATMALGLLCVVAAAAFQSVVPWLMRRAVDDLRAGAPAPRLWALAGAMVGLALAGGGFRYGMRELLNGVSRRIEYDLRNALFAHLTTLDARWYARNRTGDIMARLTNDLSAVRMAAGPAIMYLMNTIAGGVFALAFMLRIDARLTLFALAPMALLPVVMIRLGSAIHTRFEAVQEHFSRLTTHAQENLSGTRIVRAYRQERAELERFGTLNEQYLEQNLRLARLYGLMNPAFATLAGLGAVTVLGVGGAMTVRGAMSVGSFVAFGVYLGILTWPLIALGWVINLFQRGAASMSRLNEILDARTALAAPAPPRSLPPARAGRSIEFRDVGFHYPAEHGGEPRWVLRHVSFRIASGGTLGVVGATGSGKSALVDLIPRLYDAQEGEILIDGVPVRALELAALRAEVGMIPQESLLFSDTVGANLTYAGASDADGLWAAGVAELTSTIAALPAGTATMLGERGINLSGGQKQRAALARALARRPNIVLLDDALSAVDTQTEAAILRALRQALAGRTAVIASHRVSALRDASWIVVLDGGTVVEQGRHHELMALGGRYWSLLRRQQLEEEVEAGAVAAG
jgi:ATP-binding cassette subfamily B multidrug efflux pump